jgi:tetratricopeptide (TPR) repeat protein
MNYPRVFRAALATAALAVTLARADSPVEQAAEDIKRGEYTHAEDLLMPLVETKRADAAAYYNMALVRMAQKRNEDAVKFAERATKGDPTKAQYFSQLGLACYARIAEVGPLDGDALATKMRKSFERALAIDPRQMAALMGLMHFYERAPEIVGGNRRKAVEFAERVRQIDPYQGEIELGRLAAGANDFESALVHYDAATKLQPDDLATATACGWTLYKLGRKNEARARFEAVLKVNPDFGPAQLGMTETAPAAH